MASRVSQGAVESLVAPTTIYSRLSTYITQGVLSPLPLSRVSQLTTQVVITGKIPTTRVSQDVVEIILTVPLGESRVSQAVAETVTKIPVGLVNSRVSQSAIEIILYAVAQAAATEKYGPTAQVV